MDFETSWPILLFKKEKEMNDIRVGVQNNEFDHEWLTEQEQD